MVSTSASRDFAAAACDFSVSRAPSDRSLPATPAAVRLGFMSASSSSSSSTVAPSPSLSSDASSALGVVQVDTSLHGRGSVFLNLQHPLPPLPPPPGATPPL